MLFQLKWVWQLTLLTNIFIQQLYFPAIITLYGLNPYYYHNKVWKILSADYSGVTQSVTDQVRPIRNIRMHVKVKFVFPHFYTQGSPLFEQLLIRQFIWHLASSLLSPSYPRLLTRFLLTLERYIVAVGKITQFSLPTITWPFRSVQKKQITLQGFGYRKTWWANNEEDCWVKIKD